MRVSCLTKKENYQEKLNKVLSLKRERAAVSDGLDIRHADCLKNFSNFSFILFSFLAHYSAVRKGRIIYSSTFLLKNLTFSGGRTAAICHRRPVTFAMPVRSRPEWSCRFLQSQRYKQTHPQSQLTQSCFLRDLQHFLNHGGECDFSEVFSTSNVRKHLAPANRSKKFRPRAR